LRLKAVVASRIMFLKFIKPASIVTTLISIHKTKPSVRPLDSTKWLGPP
jgi:hypothetical protein